MNRRGKVKQLSQCGDLQRKYEEIFKVDRK